LQTKQIHMSDRSWARTIVAIGTVVIIFTITNHGRQFSYDRWRLCELLIFPVVFIWYVLGAIKWSVKVVDVTSTPNREASPGSMVVLTELPPGFLESLPIRDQRALSRMVGKPVRLVGYDAHGKAEIEFTDSDEISHSICLDPSFIVPVN
jgi:hypothetical protein